jgi:hypothetical protein
VLPEPLPIRRQGAPFVGNTDSDDNIDESVRVALWAILGDVAAQPDIGVAGGVVTLRGEVANPEDRDSCDRAVRHLRGVVALDNRLKVTEENAGIEGGSPILYVRRFCSLEDASIQAATASGLRAVARRFGGRAAEWAATAIVIYRNLRDGTATLDISVPAAGNLAGGEVKPEIMPVGPDLTTTLSAASAAALRDARAELVARAISAALQPQDCVWHTLEPDSSGSVVLHLPVTTAVAS